MRVLLVGPNLASAHRLIAMLGTMHVIADHCDSGHEAVGLARHYDYDVVLVQGRLTDMASHDAIRQMRLAGLHTPLMVLFEHANVAERVRNFSAGADDVITASVDSDELLARLRALVRRGKGFSQSVLSVGPVQLNQDSREVHVEGRRLSLTGKEYAILELLVLRKGMALTKETFLTHLYGGVDEPEAKIIDVFICKLRKKLAEAGAENVIGTVWGRGYTIRSQVAVAEPAPQRCVPGISRSRELVGSAA